MGCERDTYLRKGVPISGGLEVQKVAIQRKRIPFEISSKLKTICSIVFVCAKEVSSMEGILGALDSILTLP
ncbi:hypothetical protein JTE90_021053 [Oedothorax gibbosus]|uniref:Uncharacterized protein n=1 Tax=Oedothorax gibbosus TaxID=931172 RepID=A0AAV6VSH6_9ARAC|nr:hypothetical protein JTE90_021053 [Oedothorax gibbosus]